MSRIAKSHVNAAFEWAANQISEAGGRDGVTSRAEIRRRIGELTGPERDLVDFFYRFIVRRGAAHNERVTRADVDAALALARQDLVAAFDTNDNGLSSDEVAAMPPLGRLAVKVARQRERSGEELAELYEELAFSLFFDDFGTELPPERFLSCHLPARLEALTAETFRATVGPTLGVEPGDPKGSIARIEDAGAFFARLIELHTPGQAAQAQALAQTMQSTLGDLAVYIVGHDPEGGPIHPVYIVGLAADGSVAGLRARLKWS